ncbi:hypothetical protein MIR68_003788 [Amoeboaphelidium protococcarum]|nr:hypothetical protein MIR68_003788 [Amoeboaphelidium protococcarum]
MPPSHAHPLLLGTSNFDEIMEKDALFIDKSLFIKEFMNDGSEVIAILRPRRFGKSTNLSMLKSFLSLNAQPRHFDRYLIGKEIDIVEKHCGKYPVVVLDLKDCKGDSWEKMYSSVWRFIREMVQRHKRELEDSILSMKEYGFDYSDPKPSNNEVVVGSSLQWLTRELNEKYGKCVVVLVDEYDAPLNHAFRQGYYNKASQFFDLLYSSALKGNSALEKACLMGIVEV